MHGGWKIYRGDPAAARSYLTNERPRADDYYLAEGRGAADRYVATGDGLVRPVGELAGDAYSAWVVGADPDTGEPRGRVRHDEHAVRFLEVTVNGPKSWSLAAELHPEVDAAYLAAQDRAATQVIGWLAQHATARVGRRGGQVATPVAVLEAVTVAHYTSRGCDPHRHLHLQVNARVQTGDGVWRAVDTVGVRDAIGAVNGIGHAAVMCDPQFRAVLAGRGYTLDGSGEIEQLAPYVGAFSARRTQIREQADRYEKEWRAVNPGQEPGRGLRQAWDTRAWAAERPDKRPPDPGDDLSARWRRELAELGYRPAARAVPVGARPIGTMDRDQAVAMVLARAGTARSAFNAADLRGEVEQLLAREHIVTDPAVRAELAEDLTARALARCVPLLSRDGRPRVGVPEHIRALTTDYVLNVEADLAGRLGVRGAEPGRDLDPAVLQQAVAPPASGETSRAAGAARPGAEAGEREATRGWPAASDRSRLDAAQAQVAAALSGDHALVVVQGAAGAGKTTTLAAIHQLLADRGQSLVIVTPTLKAAATARKQTGARAGSAAWLAHQHGWRWDEHGTWTRLRPGDLDPVTGHEYRGPADTAALRAGDLLVVDEAGMLDQDTARALITIADQHRARVALIGDRHQLPAVGRGGVLDLAERWAERTVTLDVIHRFVKDVEVAPGILSTVTDTDYADLSTRMRTGQEPADVFDRLVTRGQIQLHTDPESLHAAIAQAVVADRLAQRPVAVVVDTTEHARQLNADIRAQMITAGLVDDQRAVTTGTGERIGVGDLIATRRNDQSNAVANRDTWTVTGIDRHGHITVTGPNGSRTLTADYTHRHIELAYAGTAHGAQGDTVTSAHLLLGEHTGAASAYVGMTRGREQNTAHLVTADLAAARAQWEAAFARDRADLGPTHARDLAEKAASRYAEPRPLELVRAELRTAWAEQLRAQEILDRARPALETAIEIAALRQIHEQEMTPAAARDQQARQTRADAEGRLHASQQRVDQDTDTLRDALLDQWHTERPASHQHAATVLAGTGRFGQHRGAVRDAAEQLARWGHKWRPVVPDLPADPASLARVASWADNTAHIYQAAGDYAQRQVLAAHPDHSQHQADAGAARTEVEAAVTAENQLRHRHAQDAHHYGSAAWNQHPDRPDQLRQTVEQAEVTDADAVQRIARLQTEPAVTSQPDPTGWLTAEHDSWTLDHQAQRAAARQQAELRALAAPAREAEQRRTRTRSPEPRPTHRPDHGPSIGR